MISTLREQAARVFPSFRQIILHDSQLSNSVWESDLRTGKALEIVSLLAIISELNSQLGCTYIDDRFLSNPDLFYLRNEIPLHHGAQAGHEGLFQFETSIEDRFLAAFLPKANFKSDDRYWMIFREGNPLHLLFSLIQGAGVYKDRCDMVLVRGLIRDFEISNGLISFTHDDMGAAAKYQISIKNSPIVPLKDYIISEDYSVKTSGVVECSVSKTKAQVDEQLARYRELYKNFNSRPECLFVHGGTMLSSFSTLIVDLTDLIMSFSTVDNRLLLKRFLDDCLKEN
jgi:hypothetical protein